MNRYALLFFLGSWGMAQAQQPATKQKWMIDKKESTITYTMKHPMHTWDGVNHDVTGVLVINTQTNLPESGAIVAKVSGFDSQNANRDSHMIEVLEGIKYPTVTFSTQSISATADGGLTVTGKLTFHGVTRTITVPVGQKRIANGWQLDSTFPVNISDYKIERPSLMMVPVEDAMTIKFHLLFIAPKTS